MAEVSIVLPVYNGQRYLGKAIDSIRNQNFEDWELIIVDDCSIDATPEIIKNYLEMDERIISIRNQVNSKLPQSLNNGFEIATGNYLTWTSDDNFYNEIAILKMYTYMKNNPQIGLVYGDMYYVDEYDNVIGSFIPKSSNIAMQNCVGAYFMYTREVRDTVGKYNVNKYLVEDYDYWIRICHHFEISYLGGKEYYYRQHGNSLTQQKRKIVNDRLAKLRFEYLEYFLKLMNQEEKKRLYCELFLQNKDMLLSRIKEFGNSIMRDMLWLEKTQKLDMFSKYIIFGAGYYGRLALEKIGEDKIIFFVDNNEALIGNKISNKEIYGPDYLEKLHENCNIIIAVDYKFFYDIAQQLMNKKIMNFSSVFQLLTE